MFSALAIAPILAFTASVAEPEGEPDTEVDADTDVGDASEAAPPAEPDTVTEPTGPTVGTLPIRIEAGLAAPDRAEIAARFSGALERSGLQLRPVRAEGADTCQEPACHRELATATDVPNLVGATIRSDGPDYTIEAYAVSGQTGEVIGEAKGICEICGVQELGDMVEGLATRLRANLDTAAAPARLRIDSDPSGAAVRVDGEPIGTTPLETEVPAGPHEIEVSRRGYRTERTQAELRAGVTGAYTYRLARDVNIPVWLPWTALGVGIGTTAAGVTLIAIDERPIERDCNDDVMGNCEFLHDTLAGGIALTVTGVALVGTGIALEILRSRKNGPRRVQAGAWLTSPGITVSGRF